jgi:hypothetical protein
MSVTIKSPHDLRALLATMKSAKKQGVHMAIWDRDIKTVEDAIITIEALRSQLHPASANEGSAHQPQGGDAREPTPEMLAAGERAWMGRNLADPKSNPIRDCYLAMVAHRPEYLP